jgi:hypothetical protein
MQTDDVAALKTNQIAALTTNQATKLTTDQVVALTTAQVAALTTDQVSKLTTTQLVAMETADVAALTTAGLAALTTTQFVAIETTDVAALKTSQIRALTTSQIATMTTDQIAALTTAQVEALTTAQVAAITTDQVSHLAWGSPIILDLNGDGVKTLSISSGVKFDLFADGAAINTGWVSSGDGLLVLDRNSDGSINDGSELFGTATSLNNGQRASDGYAALRELDSNNDGVISSEDAAFADLRIWVDGNSDGVSGGGEMHTLDSLGISSINAQAVTSFDKDNGNLLGLTSSYQTTDGTTHAAADVWFVADRDQHAATAATNVSTQPVDAAIAALNDGTVADVAPMSTDAWGAPETTAQIPVVEEPAAQGPAEDNMRSRVSGLAQAIGSFTESGSTEKVPSATGLTAASSVPAAPSAAALAVVSMADVMKQFDANGNLIAVPGSNTAAPTKLNVPGIQDPTNTGFLASGGKSS